MTSHGTVILHIGLPKTGTTALQNWCAGMRADLARESIVYPDPDPRCYDPKHQYVVEDLKSMSNAHLKRILDASEGKTVALSTEGLTNQFWDFSQGQLAKFRDVLAGWDTKVFVVSRQPQAWLKSYYKQCVINPWVQDYPYATKLELDDFIRLDRVRFLCDLPNQSDLLGASFGGEVVRASYESDWLRDWCLLLGWQADDAAVPTSNESLNDETIDFIRAVNGLDLPAEYRSLLLGLLQREIGSTHTVLRIYANHIGPAPAGAAECRHALDSLTSAGGHIADIADRVRHQLQATGAAAA